MPLTGYITLWYRGSLTGAAYWFPTEDAAIDHARWQWACALPPSDQVVVLALDTLTVIWTPELATTHLQLSEQPPCNGAAQDDVDA